MPFRLDDVEISWLGHAAFLITYKDTRYYIDPFKIKAKGLADVVLITHEHFDHLSVEDLRKIVKSDTEMVAPESCRDNLKAFKMGVLKLVKPGESINVKNARVETIPAYNINKFRAPGVVYHPKVQEGVGYILEVGGLRIYHAGDTDFTPEMRSLKVDVALVPVSGTFVMTAEEAAKAVNTFKPKVAIPMHFGAIVGDKSDAENFKKLSEVDVVILEKE
ncbi:MAG: MBL fold metallo-hydrolase [Nitrososphaeria archaeon]|nr:MBL fold metallo-hydrolase [Aigarchaeota archaeon]MCX8187279.1 MBL fold metallo-hydrolase [Nitrososphaeria archaeon]MDW8021015.1 MBL fold metallo-hydrolase [Nitrososphaerota archaeon]